MTLPLHAREYNQGYEEVEITDHEGGKMTLRILQLSLAPRLSCDRNRSIGGGSGYKTNAYLQWPIL